MRITQNTPRNYCLIVLVLGFAMWTQAANLDAKLDTLTLRQKVGQLHMIGAIGEGPTPENKDLIDDWGLGGFFFQVGNNYADPTGCAENVNALQRAALESEAGIPLLIAMDQEGGVGSQLHYSQGATPTPGNLALGASGREEDAYAAYFAMGTDMRACGVTVNFAPAIDVAYNPNNPDYPVRLFSGDIDINAVMARGAVRGMQDAGAIACAKHWPGLAYYGADTHFSAPHIKKTDAELRQGNLKHFRAAIDAGTDMIMTHMVYLDAWDPHNIATVSPIVIGQILRKELGYGGLVVTDSMSMGSIADAMDIGEASVQCILAGCDIVLQVSRSVKDLEKRMNAVLSAAKEGRIAEKRIDQSVRRILKAKQKYGLFDNPFADLDKLQQNLGRADNVQANQRAAANGVVLVRDEDHLLPLPKTGKKILVVSPPSVIQRAGKPEGWDVPIGTTLGEIVQQIVPDALVTEVNTMPTFDEQDTIVRQAADADIIIGYALLARFASTQYGLINRLLALGKPTVIIGMGDPGDMEFFPEVRAFVAANSPAPICVEAAVNVIFGDVQPGGKLPMPIGNLYPIGYALE
jgi:beta-N-acetylhexosaminidase